MNAINKLGLRVAALIIMAAGGGYGIYRGVVMFVANKPIESGGPHVSSTPSAAIEDLVQKDVAAVGDSQANVLRTKIVQQLNASDSYTAKYLATLPANLPQTQVLDKTKVAAFVDQNKGQLLPIIPTGQIKLTTNGGKDAIKAYVDAISPTTDSQIKAVTSDDIQQAYQTFYADPQHSTALKDIETTLQANVEALKAVSTPQEAAAIQTKLLAASESLATNVALLETMPKDLVGGLIAASNIQDLGPVFSSIQTDIDALQKKYSL